jgi:cysteine desulfurase/selenocysteine lyase
VAVRTGHHCTQPLHAILGAPGSIRASLFFYNNQEDVDTFILKLKDTINMFESMKL